MYQERNDALRHMPAATNMTSFTHSFAPPSSDSLQASLVLPIEAIQAMLGANQSSVTLPTAFLAVFTELLGRFLQQETIEIQVVVSDVPLSSTDPALGVPLALAIDLADETTFRIHAQRIQQVYDKASVALMNGAVHDDLSPTFHATLVFEPTLEIDAWHVRVAYHADYFTANDVANLGIYFPRLLHRLLAAPDGPMSAAALLDPHSPDEAERAEWQQVVVAWNATSVPYPRDATLAEIVIAQAQATPDAIAVVSQDTDHLSYGALLARASQLAHHLRTVGVGPDVPVGMCVERSPDLIPALVAILLAGGAYVPLDPTYPAARLQHMLADAGVPLVLTQAHLHAPLQDAGVPLLDLATLWQQVAHLPIEPPFPQGAAEHLAYVCYTSGSTGVPKGVAIPQRGVLRMVLEATYADFGPGETLLQFAPLAFDAATFEIWGPLLSGGRLVVAPAGLVPLDVLGATILRQGITTLWLTAGLFHLMVEEQLASLRGVRHLLAGGDVLHPASVQRVLDAYPDHKLTNGYGPTETTTFAATYPMTGRTQIGRTVPIGKPLTNSTAYVLDGQMHPVPVGMPGELYLGGDGLARGYWRRPDLTAERFVPHPFIAGERVYRTGDLARWLASGDLEFLGRRDGQVKIRGYRIEVGEIERMLEQQAGVQASEVMVHTTPTGDKHLVGYVVGAGVEGGRLREHIQGILPAYLVPSAIVVLDALPLMPNGKVDRHALPVPEHWHTVPPGEAPPHEPPQGEREAHVAAIWTAVLHREHIGRHDDFFALGGHSLLATQLVARLRAAFQVDMPLVAIFEHPTVAGIATFIASLPTITANDANTKQIQRVSRGDRDLTELLNMIEQLSDDDIQALLVEDAHEE